MKFDWSAKSAKRQRLKAYTLQLEEPVIEAIDKISESFDISRQKLINAILKKAVNDPNFVLPIETE